MTQSPDDTPGGSGAVGPPPASQYGRPAGPNQPQQQQPQYQQPQQQQPQYQQPQYQPQRPPAGPYGYPGGPYGPKPPRETGALVVCIVLLVLALIGSFIASRAVYNKLTDDSSSSAPPVGGSYAPGGVGAQGSSSTDVPNGTTSTSADPDAVGKRLVRNFPLYRGARRVASSKKYLPPGSPTSKYGKTYVVQRNANTVYNWYLRHLSRDHLEYSGGSASTIRDRDTGKVIDAFGVITSPVTQSVNGNFNIETGRQAGTCVLTVTLYG